MSETYLIRESINAPVVRELAERIQSGDSSFDSIGFSRWVNRSLSSLSLTERIERVVTGLHRYFSGRSFEESVSILLRALPPELPIEGESKKKDLERRDLSHLNGFIMVALTEYVSRFGEDHFDLSMNAFYELTKRFSAEGPIRRFIINQPKKTLKVLFEWADDKDAHVRRLTSECTRPRLPWAVQLSQFRDDPRPVLPILEKLKKDPVLYVRRSVANHLNDISKDHPDVVVRTLKKWKRGDSSEELRWLIRHSLRTLVKAGHPEALKLLGVSPDVEVSLKTFQLSPKRVRMGEGLSLKVDLRLNSERSQDLIIDYVVYHMRANGRRSPKVFKWTKKTAEPDETLRLSKSHFFREITTRRYYPGKHEIAVQVNGREVGRRSFMFSSQ